MKRRSGIQPRCTDQPTQGNLGCETKSSGTGRRGTGGTDGVETLSNKNRHAVYLDGKSNWPMVPPVNKVQWQHSVC